MVENWNDVNKYWDGRDDYLCWGAAIANALSFTGLLDRAPYEIYDMIRAGSNRERHWIYQAITAFYRIELQREVPVDCFKILPPSSIWVLNEMERIGACAILGLTDEDGLNGHALTAYRTKENIDFASNDPRSVKQLYCADSDDDMEELLWLETEYNIREKKARLKYKEGYVLRCAVLVLPKNWRSTT